MARYEIVLVVEADETPDVTALAEAAREEGLLVTDAWVDSDDADPLDLEPPSPNGGD